MRRMMIVQLGITAMFIFMSMGPGISDQVYIDNAQIQEILRKDKGGILRGIHFNMKKDQVLNLESGGVVFLNGKRKLGFDLGKLRTTFNNELNVYYDFDYKGLYLISLVANQKDKHSATKLYRALKKHFDQVHGESFTNRKGNDIWICKDSTTGLPYRISFSQFGSELFLEFNAI